MCLNHRTACGRAAAVRAVAMSFTPVLMMFLFATTEQWLSPSIGIELVTSAHAKENEKKATKYTCPMHPHYIADHPGTCPICGMDLIKVAAIDPTGEISGEKPQAITVAPETLQNMGVRIAKVEKASFGRRVRSTGMVMENDRLRTELTGRSEGWIEDLKVTAVGDQVTNGMVLFEMFSPELLVTQRNYLRALANNNRRDLGAYEQRLRAFGVQPQVIELLAKRRREFRRVPFYADRDGTVADLPIVNGSYVKRGMTIMRIQDYTKVWLVVSVAEKDLPFMSTETLARVTFPNIPGRTFDTRVDYIYPTIDTRTRTGKVRLVIDNTDGVIRPGSFADVIFIVDSEPRVAVASEAVLRSEAGSFVVAAVGGGRFEPRSVATGLVSGRWTEIRQGLKVGDNVVVSGQFMLDSESALRESFRKLEQFQLHLALLKLDETQLAMLDHMVDAALYIHEATTSGFEVDAKFLDPAREVRDALWPAFHNTKLAIVLTDAEKAITAVQVAKTKSQTTTALAKLTGALEPWLREGVPSHYKRRKVQIYKDSVSGNLWLQLAGTPANPYGPGNSELLPWPDTPAPGAPASTAHIKPQLPDKRDGHAGH